MFEMSILSRLFAPREKREREGTAPRLTLKEMLTAQIPPWDRVPHAFIQLVVEVLDGTGLLDVFIMHSVEEGLVARYAIICEGDFYAPVIRAQISQILCQTGNRALPALAKLIAKGQRGDKGVKALMLCCDCFEAAIAFQRTQVAGYIGLAHAYATIGRRDKSHEYAERGLSLVAELRADPLWMSARGESRFFPIDIDDQMERQLRIYLEH
jgi:hypothetical protein